MHLKKIFILILCFMSLNYSYAQQNNCCRGSIFINAQFGCPSLKFGDVYMTASSGTLLPSNQFTYKWSPNAGLNSYSTQTVKLTDTVSRQYTVLIRNIYDTSFFCIDTIDVNRPNSNLPIYNVKDTLVCQNETVNIGNISKLGQSYYWVNNQPKISNINSSNPTVLASLSDNYILRITDNSSGCYIYDTSKVSATIVDVDAGNHRTICSNAIIKLGAGNHKVNQIYKWSPGNSNWQNATDSSFRRPDVFIGVSTTFIVLAIDTVSGCQKKDTVIVTVDNYPTISNFPDTAICSGSSIRIGTIEQTGVTYSWTPSSGLSCSSCSFTQATPNTTRTYYLLATYLGACSNNPTDSIKITVRNPAFTLNDINYCPSNGAFAIGGSSPSGMSSYQWSPAVLVSSPNSAATNTLNPPPSVRTTFKLTVTDAKGCRAFDELDIIPSIIAPIAGNNQSICLSEGTTNIGSSANATGAGISYSWSPSVGLNNPNIPNPTLTLSNSGNFTYVLTKTDANISCSNSASVTISVKDYKIPVMSNKIICKNGSIEIGTTSSPGAQYFWIPGSNLSDSTASKTFASPLLTSIYKLKSIGANSCKDEQYISVTVNNDSVPQITMPSIDICLEDKFDTIKPIITPKSNSYQYLWSGIDAFIRNTNDMNAIVNLNIVGTRYYNLNVTNTANGCVNNANLIVKVKYCPLSFESIQFNVNCKENLIQIDGLSDWFKYFHIESSKDGINYTKYSDFAFSNTLNSGQYLLQNNNISNYKYFKLMGFDDQNKGEILTIIENECFENGFSINLYPNPSNGITNIEIRNLKEEAYKIIVYNNLGKLVFDKDFEKSNLLSIDTKAFNSGTYWIVVQSKIGVKRIKKLIVI